MKSFRFYKWPCIRLTLVWTVFFLCMFWYNIKDKIKPMSRPSSSVTSSENDGRNIFLSLEERNIDSVTPNYDDDDDDDDDDDSDDDDDDGDDDDDDDGEKDTERTIEHSQKDIFDRTFLKSKEGGFENVARYWKELSGQKRLIPQNKEFNPNSANIDGKRETVFRVNESKIDKHKQHTKHDPHSVPDHHGKDSCDMEDSSSAKTPQGCLIISLLRDKVDNPLVLKANRLHWTIAMRGGYSERLYTSPMNELPKQRLPQAIVIGFGKCGTRALVTFLSMHPYIVTTGPEVHFFDLDENFKKGLEWYRAQMPLSYSNQITVEKTPSYIWSERAMDEIYKLDRNMKLIVILKDPVSRILSQFVRSSPDTESMFMMSNNGTFQVNNESRTVQWSVYVRYLRAWMKKFPKSQIHITESNEFVKEPAKQVEKIEQFLGVPHLITEKNFYFNETKGFYCMRPFHLKGITCLPEGKGRPHPELKPAIQKKLYDFFRGYNEELFQLLGRRFPWQSSALDKSSQRQ